MTEAELLNEFLETNSYVGERPWREMSDLDEDEDDEEEDEDEDDEDEEEDEDDEDEDDEDELKTLGDVEGHDFHGNQWTDDDYSTPRASEVDRLQDALIKGAGLDPTDVQSQQLSDGVTLINIHSDVRGYAKQRIVSQLSKELEKDSEYQKIIGNTPGIIGHPENYFSTESFVQHKLDGWAHTSGDSDPTAVTGQLAVKNTFSLHDAGTNHLGGVPYLNPEKVDELYVRAEYEHTQRWLKEKGIEHVTVFRGVYGVNIPVGTKQEIEMQPASSWTTDVDIALAFALEGADHRRVLAVRVPASRVLSTAITGRGALSESEVILLGGKAKVNSYDLIANKSNPIRFRDELIITAQRVKADMR